MQIAPNLKPSEQVILLHLFTRANNDYVEASQQNLIAWTGLTRNSIKVAIQALQIKGLLKVIRQGQKNAPCIFQVSLDPPSSTEGSNNREIKPSPLLLPPDGRLRMAAIKQSLSPQAWRSIKMAADLYHCTEDQIILKNYFGPERVRQYGNDDKNS